MQQFTTSMTTQLDELESDRHMKMAFPEFLEAFARVAEKLEIPNIADGNYTLSDI